MYYTLYKTTNKINGKFYIGTHKTEDLNDSYMGSGKLLKLAIEKYGLDNFQKEILFIFDNPEDMFAKEAEIVTEEFLAEENTYNLKVGGFGGFDYLNSTEFDNISHKRDHMMKMVDAQKKIYPNGVFYGKTLSAESRRKISDRKKGNTAFLGKRHSQETIEKMRAISANRGVGTKNTQYGTCWITDGSLSKKIKRTDPIPEGWRLGRFINK